MRLIDAHFEMRMNSSRIAAGTGSRVGSRRSSVFVQSDHFRTPTLNALLALGRTSPPRRFKRFFPAADDLEEAFHTTGFENLDKPRGETAENEPAAGAFDRLADIDHQSERGASHVIQLRKIEHPV